MPKRNVVLNGATISTVTADFALKARSGDGLPLRDLTERDYLDVFVHDGDSHSLNVPGLPFTLAQSLKPDWSLALLVEWKGVNGDGTAGQTLITWTNEARRTGRWPRVSSGKSASELWQYMRDISHPVTRRVLRSRLPVIPMTPFDHFRRTTFKETKPAMTSPVANFTTFLEIEGFRGFRQMQKLQLAIPNGRSGSGLTIVVGANNAGKSTVWESFDAIARKSKSDVSFSEGRRNRKSTNGIRISLLRQDGSNYVLRTRSGDTSETEADWYGIQNDRDTRIEIVAVPSRRQFQASFGKNMTSQRDWMSVNSDFSRSQQRDEFTGRLFDLHNDESKKALFDDLMESVLGYRLDWTIDLSDGQHGSSYYLKVTTGEGVNHTSEGLGDGIISLIFILNAMYDAQPDTLLVIDEPELSLHPQLVRRLGRAMSKLSSDRQIVVFTHSPDLVSWDDIADGAEIARVFKTDGESIIAQASRATISEITTARRGWRNPHTLGGDANEALFLDDGVIVVEGQEDAALLPTAFIEAGVPLTGNIWGWGSGGKDNVPRIVALLRDLGFSRVVAVLDNNVPDTVQALKSSFPEYLVVEIPAADIRDKPASKFAGVAGLLDAHGRTMKPELVDDAREVLLEVSNYVAAGKSDEDLLLRSRTASDATGQNS